MKVGGYWNIVLLRLVFGIVLKMSITSKERGRATDGRISRRERPCLQASTDTEEGVQGSR